MCGQAASGVPHQLLGGEPAHALHKAALNLANVDGRVDGAAHVVQDVHPQHPVLPGQGVDGDLGAGGAVGKVIKRSAGECGLVVVDFGGAVEAVAPELDAVGVGQAHHIVKGAGSGG